jgi:cytochrome c peroxidase
MQRKMLLKRLLISFLVIVGLLGVTVFALGFLPVTEDPQVDPRTLGAGASSVAGAWSGLQRDFPSMERTAATVDSPEAVELGRLLFFDPILSVNNDRSCASCHHPDLGFADGLSHPVGINGQTLPRHTPTLWNVGWARPLFWDGRAATLEEQAGEPLLHPLEMGSNAEGLALKLRNIPEYVARFEAVFGAGDALSFEHIVQALAAFERTLTSTASAYDRFAAGDFNALSKSQQRGLNLFRSAATRCFECHMAPIFTNNSFRAIGVPEEAGQVDPGRRTVADDAKIGAFRVPTLRNIALTAPYMHNGRLTTLEEVVQFYADGGGRAFDNEDVDFFIQGFTLSEQEKADLVAFLYALTDESGLPAIPAAAPSGLPVVRAQCH